MPVHVGCVHRPRVLPQKPRITENRPEDGSVFDGIIAGAWPWESRAWTGKSFPPLKALSVFPRPPLTHRPSGVCFSAPSPSPPPNQVGAPSRSLICNFSGLHSFRMVGPPAVIRSQPAFSCSSRGLLAARKRGGRRAENMGGGGNGGERATPRGPAPIHSQRSLPDPGPLGPGWGLIYRSKRGLWRDHHLKSVLTLEIPALNLTVI